MLQITNFVSGVINKLSFHLKLDDGEEVITHRNVQKVLSEMELSFIMFKIFWKGKMQGKTNEVFGL